MISEEKTETAVFFIGAKSSFAQISPLIHRVKACLGSFYFWQTEELQ